MDVSRGRKSSQVLNFLSLLCTWLPVRKGLMSFSYVCVSVMFNGSFGKTSSSEENCSSVGLRGAWTLHWLTQHLASRIVTLAPSLTVDSVSVLQFFIVILPSSDLRQSILYWPTLRDICLSQSFMMVAALIPQLHLTTDITVSYSLWLKAHLSLQSKYLIFTLLMFITTRVIIFIAGVQMRFVPWFELKKSFKLLKFEAAGEKSITFIIMFYHVSVGCVVIALRC